MNKICTDIPQSKQLAKMLSIESADMHYVRKTHDFMGNPVDGEWSHPKYGNPDSKYANYIIQNFEHYERIPCWSLAALLEVLPLGIYDEFDGNDYELEIDMINKMPRYIRLGDIYHSQFPYDFEKDALLDNIVESIIWLNDNNYFEL